MLTNPKLPDKEKERGKAKEVEDGREIVGFSSLEIPTRRNVASLPKYSSANEQRENVREENIGDSFGQIGKILGRRWKALIDKQRAPMRFRLPPIRSVM